jgi:hypothetical protein
MEKVFPSPNWAKVLELGLSFQKYPGQTGVQPPISYRWKGNKFIKEE